MRVNEDLRRVRTYSAINGDWLGLDVKVEVNLRDLDWEVVRKMEVTISEGGVKIELVDDVGFSWTVVNESYAEFVRGLLERA